MGGVVQEVKSKLDEMVEGYSLGLEWNLGYDPHWLDGKSPAFKHGFQNGRDDCAGLPRERADVLLHRARMIIGE